MQDIAFGSRVRGVRVRLRLRQVDVAARAGVSDATVSRIERGHVQSLSLRSIRSVASALEIRVDLMPRWRGGDLDRMVGSAHARLADSCIAWLGPVGGWIVQPEVSFSRFGERGIIDLLAWHEERRAVLVIELKTQIVDIGELLGTLDRKARLAREVAAERGWVADQVGLCLLVAEGRTNRRRVLENRRVLRAALPDDGWRLRAWLRASGPGAKVAVRALAFLPDRHPGTDGQGSAARQRVRRPMQRVDRAGASTNRRA